MLLRDHLPYTEATIREAQRIRTIAPSSIPHETTAPATILGHQIPAGTFILPNLWSLHMDPKYWPDPERFDPTRFLDADGQLAPGTESFLPFSIGEACKTVLSWNESSFVLENILQFWQNTLSNTF
ncbi:PREDICTED: cytochrome P450 2U1-like [Branchiostoma belcheri]|uniref:Cytochrome P450 2U1-like n=1 Tax=Branchiostoma belcheri TaxID=7741 RepID=A0A6P4Y2Y6_BRABE|nr:PREDICTED: cytochrome P450 2U1-like [Branchiostoma belcheri]